MAILTKSDIERYFKPRGKRKDIWHRSTGTLQTGNLHAINMFDLAISTPLQCFSSSDNGALRYLVPQVRIHANYQWKPRIFCTKIAHHFE